MNTIDEAIAILQAMKEGKKIQVKANNGEWRDFNYDDNFPYFRNGTFRIKPAARLLTVDELPDVIWLKNKAGSVFLVTGICDGLLVTEPSLGRGCCIQFLKDEGALWSDSRKGPWKSFETEVTL